MTDKPVGKQQKPTSGWKSHKSNPRRSTNISASGMHNDDAGIFITCDKGQEAKCLREIDDILSEYLSTHQNVNPETDISVDAVDIEEDIRKELQSMRSTSTNPKRPYSFVRLDIACVSFIRMLTPLDPVLVARQICEDAYSSAGRVRSRYVKRLTPVSCMRKTLGNGLEQLCETVLKPVFGAPNPGKKFAIRPTIRNNAQLDRDVVIKTVANAVAEFNQDHSVDLKNYDCLILVEIYRNICGMSVVGQDFEKLRRFNLSEIYPATNEPAQTFGM